MSQKEKYESFRQETHRLEKKMFFYLGVIFAVLVLMVAVLILLYFAAGARSSYLPVVNLYGSANEHGIFCNAQNVLCRFGDVRGAL